MAQLTPDFFETILKMEGGYQDIPEDTGNYACGVLVGTNMGVSAVALSNWYNRCITRDEMENLDVDTAFSFYAWYFDIYNCYKIESQKLAELCMNNTMGSPTGAAKTEQRALNKLGYNVTVDGNRGPNTLAALNAAWKRSPSTIYNAIRDEWIVYLKSLNRPQFIDGWLYRVNKYFPAMAQVKNGFMVVAFGAILTIYFITKKKQKA